MENVAEALKMAFAVLMFVLALTLCISSFSQAREAVDSIITIKDRETSYTYVTASKDGTRTVGAETIVPTLYKAYKENFEVHFLDIYGNKLILYDYVKKKWENITKKTKKRVTHHQAETQQKKLQILTQQH